MNTPWPPVTRWTPEGRSLWTGRQEGDFLSDLTECSEYKHIPDIIVSPQLQGRLPTGMPTGSRAASVWVFIRSRLLAGTPVQLNQVFAAECFTTGAGLECPAAAHSHHGRYHRFTEAESQTFAGISTLSNHSEHQPFKQEETHQSE